MNKMSQETAVHATYLIDDAFSAMLPGLISVEQFRLRVYSSDHESRSEPITTRYWRCKLVVFHMLLSKIA